tara:strand:- start:222 stop:608 length:387 start_codon:yes stop_codon:yes gene_type:complete
MYNFVDTQDWIPIHTIPGFEACIEYHISRKGEVKSSKGKVEKILKSKVSTRGHLKVNLTQRLSRGKHKTVAVHTLVALAFLGNPPTPTGRKSDSSEIYFIDGDRTNCKVENLKWVIRKERSNEKKAKI